MKWFSFRVVFSQAGVLRDCTAGCLFLALEDTKLVSHQWWLFYEDFIFDVCTNEKNLVSLIFGRFTEILFC